MRLIVRRVRPTPGTQLALLVDYTYHPFITDREGELLELEADHRRHAEVENVVRDLKYSLGLNHLPSGRFGANAAWLAFNVIAYNLARWVGRLGLQEGSPRARCAAVSSRCRGGSPAQPGGSPSTSRDAGRGGRASSPRSSGCVRSRRPFQSDANESAARRASLPRRCMPTASVIGPAHDHPSSVADLRPSSWWGSASTDCDHPLASRAEWPVVGDLTSEAVDQGLVLPARQSRLWPLYDFAVVPITLLSAAYQGLLHHISPGQARGEGVLYTPPTLVDLLLDEVLPWPDRSTEMPRLPKVLDPACGSGIFLVEAFRRLLAHERVRRGVLTATDCERILTIDVTAFSLDVAFLDALSEGREELGRFPALRVPKGINLRVADALTTPFTESFDLVIGNPPWKRVTKADSREWPLDRWRPVPLQKAAAFLRLALELAPRGQIAFVMPAKWMFNREGPDADFRESVFGTERVVFVANLSAFVGGRGRLFAEAQSPAAILVLGSSRDPEREIHYWGPFPSRNPRIFVRDRSSEWKIRTPDLLEDSARVLKSLFGGGPHHRRLVERLASAGPRLGDLIAEEGLVVGRGLQAHFHEGEPLVPGVRRYLPVGAEVGLRVHTRDLEDAPPGRATRNPDPALFRGPRVIVPKGLVNGRPAASYLEAAAWFTDNFTAVSGRARHRDLLRALAAYLNSSIVGYLAILTSSTWGVDRRIINKGELLEFPIGPLIRGRSVRLLARLVDQASSDNRDAILGRVDAVVVGAFGVSDVGKMRHMATRSGPWR